MLMLYWFTCAVSLFVICDGWTDTKQRNFKDGFMFGVATSAYQVEGAWNLDGKGESIWDKFLHESDKYPKDGRDGDEACASYHLYKRDVQMLRELGVDHYRFSISWPRVMTTGLFEEINEKGLLYYTNLIKELLKYNIEPVVTMYHFDLPQHLQRMGGWTNPRVQEWFEDYAMLLFDRFGDSVKYWITINQPDTICFDGYGSEEWAPGSNRTRGVGDYYCAKNVLLAHARAYRLYEKKYKAKQKGMVGISLSMNWIDPLNNKTENEEAAAIAKDFRINMFLNPIWSKKGDFPQAVKDRIAQKSKEQGYHASRLPKLTYDERKSLIGSADFLGVNHYTTYLASATTKNFPIPSLEDDIGVEYTYGKEWKPSHSPWLKSAPYGLYKALVKTNIQYDYPKMFITEHGWSTGRGLQDHERIAVMKEYFKALLLALDDGTDCIGYTHWSLMDNIEWTAGSSERFGLYEVDFDSSNKTRTARSSAFYYKHLIQSRVVDDWTPRDSMKIKISNRRTKQKNEEL